jgi:hypothetical protein
MGESDLRRLLAELVDHFALAENASITTEELSDEQCPAFDTDDSRAEDIGVGAYKSTDLEELSRMLAFPDGRPVQFSPFRSPVNGYDAWDDEKERRWEQGGEGMIPMQGQWHQLAGVCGIIDKVFLGQEAPPKTSHILIADDVGLGKTLEIMMVLAFVMQVYVCEENAEIEQRPPIVTGGECDLRTDLDGHEDDEEMG